MNMAPFPSLTPRELVRLLVAKRTLWAAPALVCGVLAAAYSLVMPRYWEASQALVVRQETAGARGPTPGKFADLYEMRTLQETILELAKSQRVVVSTLKAVDQRMTGAATEPTAEEIEKFRKHLKMLPPNGGEFGKTEVFYFCVKDTIRERAIERLTELCRQLDVGLRELRVARAQSLIVELEQEVAAATATLERDTQRLSEFEAQIGGDLGELRMLHSASSGQSDLRQEAVQLEADHRKFATQVRETEQLLALLRAAEKDPLQLVVTPNSLLTSQPALRRLKDGLVDAQLATARLAGTRSADHPRVRAAAEAEKQIRNDLHRELVSAISGAEVELRLSQQRLASTQARKQNLGGRLNRLAEQRAEYSNRVAALDSSRQSLDYARQNLNTAKAAEAAAQSGSLVTRLDVPETGPHPAGPGRTVITGAGAMGGLILGLGVIFLTTGAPSEHARSNDNRLQSDGVRSELRQETSVFTAANTPAATDRYDYVAAATLQNVVKQPAATFGQVPPGTGAKLSTQNLARTSGERVAATMSDWPSHAVRQVAIAPAGEPGTVAGGLQPRKGPLPIPPGVLPTLGATTQPATPIATGGATLQEALQAVQGRQP